MILFATGAPATFGANVAVAEALAKAVASDALGFPSQLVVASTRSTSGPATRRQSTSTSASRRPTATRDSTFWTSAPRA